MEPIEHEVSERQARLERLAAGLRHLESRRARRLPADEAFAAEMDRDIADRQREIRLVQFGINELEDIIAEGPNPPRLPRPAQPTLESITGRRRLTPDERQLIADKARAALPPQLLTLDIEINVEPLTAPDGSPHVHIIFPTLELDLGQLSPGSPPETPDAA